MLTFLLLFNLIDTFWRPKSLIFREFEEDT